MENKLSVVAFVATILFIIFGLLYINQHKIHLVANSLNNYFKDDYDGSSESELEEKIKFPNLLKLSLTFNK